MIIIANPIYDSVFKALMAKIEIARGILSALIGLKIISLRLVPQEHVRKDTSSGDVVAIRMDFCAVIETEEGRTYQVIIELQKARFGWSPLRFRHYLANRYMAIEEIQGEEGPRQIALPIISIYLLGFSLSSKLPMATHVARHYENAVTGKPLKQGVTHEFIEQLTHDAFFIQIPKITGKMGSEMERVLSIFDQHRVVAGDKHRLEFDETLIDTDPLVGKILQTLNRLQESPAMEKLMTLEDVFLLEQKQAADEVRDEFNKKLKKEQTLRKEADRKREEEQRMREEEQRMREEEQRMREEEQRMREEEQRMRLTAEAEVERLRKLLENGD